MTMKDRVNHSNVKKPSNRLFRAMIATVVLTVVFTTFCSIALFRISSENKTLTTRIENYTVQIDMLENNDNQVRMHNTNTNND